MKEKEFKSFLKSNLNQSDNTIKSRISNVKRIEKTYGDLDKQFALDQFKELFFLLTVKKDEKKRHEIEIVGNEYTGTATLKAALGLYNEFKELEYDENCFKDVEKIETDNTSTTLKRKLEVLFSSIKYTKKEFKGKVDDLQALIFDKLTSELAEVEWRLEEKISEKYLDRVDIIGYESKNDLRIIIELDAYRADQVSKKFLSRQALTINDNVFYVSLCYPGTKKMSKGECAKYFEYCANLTNSLNSEKVKKEYLGIFL